jgi:hypothetical protein
MMMCFSTTVPSPLAIKTLCVFILSLISAGYLCSKCSVQQNVRCFNMLAQPARAQVRFLLRCMYCIALSVPIAACAVWGAYGFRYSAFAVGECVQWKSNWDAGLGNQHGSLTGSLRYSSRHSMGFLAGIVRIARENKLFL